MEIFETRDYTWKVGSINQKKRGTLMVLNTNIHLNDRMEHKR